MKELIEAFRHLIEIIENDDLMFNGFPPLVKAKQALSKYENKPEQKTLEDMVYEAGQNINGEMFISPLDAIDIAKEYARNQYFQQLNDKK
jgi:hypothetical protein